jgi:hypothetical protein
MRRPEPRADAPARGRGRAHGVLDVVWTWDPVTPIPGLAGSLPVIGFEIESSWRTRKHVKGDLLNLQDAGVALGAIVLAGADARDESLRRFATSLVDRRGTRVLIWTEEDVRALAAGQSRPSAIETESVRAAARASASGGETVGGGVEHTGKYRALWSWLRAQDRAPVTLTFTDLERRPGVVLPDSCRNHLRHCGRPSESARWRPADAAHSRPSRHAGCWRRGTRQPCRCRPRPTLLPHVGAGTESVLRRLVLDDVAGRAGTVLRCRRRSPAHDRGVPGARRDPRGPGLQESRG